ncbi:MAG: type II secretion system protein GspN [Deltaproteobacteria bacterium]|nr:type II secretion system protein GspN [Deltaproteobacteria bacterium]
MKLKPKLSRAVAGYLLAALIMLPILLYLRFPGEAVRDYIKASVAARFPQSLPSLGAVRPSFLPGLAIENVTVGFRGRPEAALHADGLTVRPEALALLRGRFALLLTAEGYGGRAQGRIDYTRLFSFTGPYKAQVDFRDVRVEKCGWLTDALSRRITGTLKGTVALTGAPQTAETGTGNLDFTLTGGSYPLLENLLGFEKLDFAKVEGKTSYRNGALRITQLILTGETLRLSLKGNILLAELTRDSRLDLTGTVEIPAQNNKRVAIAIGGTLGNPTTKFL